ncbi:unnamed protein product [Durusdinium trenchii]|uniref:Tyrosine-protein kinase ephrin type A/B receptor-like domain-containing protein n=2 Tax=Durusdinium trenchii TaxID=1381693 RepID=A0ABP0RZE8_9DINO
MKSILLCLFLLHFFCVFGKQCFLDAIPESDRVNLTLDGYSMPVGLWRGAWDSSLISSKIYGILLSEIMGYQVEYGTGSGSYSYIWMLAGCSQLNPTDIQADCVPPRRWHFAFESWQEGRPYVRPALLAMGEYAPASLGSPGYAGYQGLFVMSLPSMASATRSGLSLTYFSHYNASWFEPQRYIPVVDEVNMTKLLTCAEAVNTAYPFLGQQYLEATADEGGVEYQDDRPLLKCWKGKWWAAPSCRHNVSYCGAVVTGGLGWGMVELVQQASFHNMPLAFATAIQTPNEYVQLNIELQSALYWWTPDSTFVEYGAQRVVFPEHNSQEYRNGIYGTQRTEAFLSTWAAGGLDSEQAQGGEFPLSLAKKFHLSNSDLLELLKDHVGRPGDPEDFDNDARAWTTACNWLQRHRNWLTWVPHHTDCGRGQGLVNLRGMFVQNISEAVGCEICPVGYASIQDNGQRTCRPCPAGSYQSFPGESSCTTCALGSMAPHEGSRECELCGLGRFANSSGMTDCYNCGDAQMQKWTTSRWVTLQEKEMWIQVQGATSNLSCACVPGTFLFESNCVDCMEGSTCPGSDSLQVLPGYFSTVDAPGEIYRCFGDVGKCPGGPPGTCALGRDRRSVACSRCESGKHAEADGTCRPCVGLDFAIFISTSVLVIMVITALYLGLLKTKRHPSPLLIVTISLAQMITIAQKLTVLAKFKIGWDEPFLSVLHSIQLLNFDLKHISIDCISQVAPLVEFSIRVLLMPLFCLLVLIVHFLYSAFFSKRSMCGSFQLAQLGRTVGTIFIICFISVFSSLLSPFQCVKHPNGKFTLQDYHDVFCNWQEEHLQMCILGAIACLLPVGFLALCTWAVLVEVPKRLEESNQNFIRACSFLFTRFRPGAEVFSVLFLTRNALVVLCQLPSNRPVKVVLLNALLYVSLILTAFYKPWRFLSCNLLDIWLIAGLMVIVDMGAVSMQEENSASAMVICMGFLVSMIVAIFVAAVYGASKHIMQQYFRKRFDFFLCHQKSAAGSFARLLKIELTKANHSAFIDSDDLLDITRLCRYVAQDTQKFVILATPDILGRKWCVAEMTTAQICEVSSVLITWPGFVTPNDAFVADYFNRNYDLEALSEFGIFKDDVKATLWWLQLVPSVKMATELTIEKVGDIVQQLTQTYSLRQRASSSGSIGQIDSPVLADPVNTEAVATALVLLSYLKKKLMVGSIMPRLLQHQLKVPNKASTVVVIITKGCFLSPTFAHWLMQVHDLPCGIVPIIAEESHSLPPSFYEELRAFWTFRAEIDAELYIQIVKAVYKELAVVFAPGSFASTQEDLELRANKVCDRLFADQLPLSRLNSSEVGF